MFTPPSLWCCCPGRLRQGLIPILQVKKLSSGRARASPKATQLGFKPFATSWSLTLPTALHGDSHGDLGPCASAASLQNGVTLLKPHVEQAHGTHTLGVQGRAVPNSLLKTFLLFRLDGPVRPLHT